MSDSINQTYLIISIPTWVAFLTAYYITLMLGGSIIDGLISGIISGLIIMAFTYFFVKYMDKHKERKYI